MNTSRVGRTMWAIAEGYIPSASTGDGRAFESHETACLLNVGDDDAHVEISVEVRAKHDEGFPEDVIRTVNENAKTLKFETQGFEPE